MLHFWGAKDPKRLQVDSEDLIGWDLTNVMVFLRVGSARGESETLVAESEASAVESEASVKGKNSVMLQSHRIMKFLFIPLDSEAGQYGQ